MSRKKVEKVVNSSTGNSQKVDETKQAIEHETNPIFHDITKGKEDKLFRYLEQHKAQDNFDPERDGAGAAIIHIAFLYEQYDLGKKIAALDTRFATLTYSYPNQNDVESPYEGENILHMAIIRRRRDIVKWVLAYLPQLIKGHATGAFFEPGEPCYFGTTPFLFAMSTNQIEVANDIVLASKHGQKTMYEEVDEYHNNVLHLAVIHDLPNIYLHALEYLIDVLSSETRRKSIQQVTLKPLLSEADTVSPESVGALVDASDGISIVCEPPSATGNEHTEAQSGAVVEEETAALTVELNALLERHGASKDLKKKVEAALQQGSAGEKEVCTEASLEQQKERVKRKMEEFIKRSTASDFARMNQFLQQRNTNELTPMTLAAAMGQPRMFRLIVELSSVSYWKFGPVTASHIPLLDLDQPVPRVATDRCGDTTYKTAIDCLCSFERITDITKHKNMDTVVANRLSILKMEEIDGLLKRKWDTVGKIMFRRYFCVYIVFLSCLIASTILARDETAEKIAYWVLEAFVLFVCTFRFLNEVAQMFSGIKKYWSESGAGRVDNICTLTTCLFVYAALICRLCGAKCWEDTFAALAVIGAWLYSFFFMLGFRSTGPFVLMVMQMIQNDLVRFAFVYVAILGGFGQAIYLVQEGRGSLDKLLSRIGHLAIAGFTGEMDFYVYYNHSMRNTYMTGLTEILAFIYVILMMILLVNLLIAMMGDTYTKILLQSEQRWLAERANIMVSFERSMVKGDDFQYHKKYAVPLTFRVSDESQHSKFGDQQGGKEAKKDKFYFEFKQDLADSWRKTIHEK